MSRSVLVAVLAGGEGRRFGYPKQLARIRGEPLLARPLRAAAALGDPVVVTTAKLLPAIKSVAGDVEVLVDYSWLPCGGPLRGAATAASTAWLLGYDTLVIVPGDAAWIEAEALEPLVEASRRCGCTASYYSARGHVYPLFAAAPPRLLAEAALEACRRGPPWRATGLLRASKRLALLGSAAAGDPVRIATVNTPRDLEERPSQLDEPLEGYIEVEGGPLSLYKLAGLLEGCDAAAAYRSEARAYASLGLSRLASHAERDSLRACPWVEVGLH